VLGFAAPAHASPFYPKCAPVGTAGNEICIRFINSNTGVDIAYYKLAGGSVTIRFSYTSGSFSHWDDGWFTAQVRSSPYTLDRPILSLTNLRVRAQRRFGGGGTGRSVPRHRAAAAIGSSPATSSSSSSGLSTS